MSLIDDEELAQPITNSARQRRISLPKIGAVPYATLMPPSETSIRRTRSAFRDAAFAAIVVFGLLISVWAWSHLQLIDANQRLISLQDKNAQILVQQSRYSETQKLTTDIAEINAIANQIDDVNINWSRLTNHILMVLPKDSNIVDISYQIVTLEDSEKTRIISTIVQAKTNNTVDSATFISSLRNFAKEIVLLSQTSQNGEDISYSVEVHFPLDEYKVRN